MKQSENSPDTKGARSVPDAQHPARSHLIEDGHAGLLDLRELDLLVLAPAVLTLPEGAAQNTSLAGISPRDLLELPAFSAWNRRLRRS